VKATTQGLGKVGWAHPIDVEEGVPVVGAVVNATAVQLVWSASAPNQVAPLVIQTNRHDPAPLVLFEYAASVTLPPVAAPPAPRPGACPGDPACEEEPATLTEVSLLEAPEVNCTDGSSKASDWALIDE
jgi:hypothetical protein